MAVSKTDRGMSEKMEVLDQRKAAADPKARPAASERSDLRKFGPETFCILASDCEEKCHFVCSGQGGRGADQEEFQTERERRDEEHDPHG